MRALILFGVSIFLTASLLADEAAHDPLAKWTVKPPVSLVSVSESGGWLATLTGDDRNLAIWRPGNRMIDESGQIAAQVIKPALEGKSIDWFRWIGADRLVVSVVGEAGQRLVILEAPTFEMRELIGADYTKGKALPLRLIAVMRKEPDHLLITIDGEKYSYASVYRLNISTGDMSLVQPALPPVVRWQANADGHVGTGIGFRARRQIVYTRPFGSETWTQIHNADFLGTPPFEMLDVSPDGLLGYALTTDATGAFVASDIDLATGKVITRYPSVKPYDHKGFLADPYTGERLAIVWHGHHRQMDIMDEQWAELRRRIAARLETDRFLITGSSADRRVIALTTDPETGPSRPWLWLDENETLQPIGPGNPGVPNGVPSELVRIDVGASQPMEALLYRTGVSGQKRAVVLVHGGPVRRDTTDWKPLVQMLVANGYTVLRPNFRGSSGYGQAWREAGYSEWGKLMQEDVLVAGKWLRDQGLADRGKLCMAGGSYGGYAALMSVIRHSRTFVCAVSWNGVTDIPGLVDHFSLNRFSALSIPRIQGDLRPGELRRRSPLYKARDIDRPVLLIHSLYDATVPAIQSVELARRLKHLGKAFRFVPIENAGHTLRTPTQKLVWFRETLDFLDRMTGRKPQ